MPVYARDDPRNIENFVSDDRDEAVAPPDTGEQFVCRYTEQLEGRPKAQYGAAPSVDLSSGVIKLREQRWSSNRATKEEKLKILEQMEKTQQVLLQDYEAYDVNPVCRMIMPGASQRLFESVHTARMTPQNDLAAVTTRHYKDKPLKFSVDKIFGAKCDFVAHNKVGLPKRWADCLIDGVVQCFVDYIAIVRTQKEMMKIEADDENRLTSHQIMSAMKGVNADAEFTEWNELMPASFAEKMKESMAQRVAGMDRSTKLNAFTKWNEILEKVKPRLIQHPGPDGAANSALINNTVTNLLYASSVFLERSIKKGSSDQVEDRIAQRVAACGSGGVASNDYGSYDSSVTDKGADYPDNAAGIRGTLERKLFKMLFARLSGSPHQHKAESPWWKDTTKRVVKVFFDAFELRVGQLGRCSGDGLTSVLNWVCTLLANEIEHIIADMILSKASAFLVGESEDQIAWRKKWTGQRTRAELCALAVQHAFQCCERGELVTYDSIRGKNDANFDYLQHFGAFLMKPNDTDRYWDALEIEGDDNVDGVKYHYLDKLARFFINVECVREALGQCMGYSSASIGMELEPQCREGVVGFAEYYSHSGRVEFTSRVFVLKEESRKVSCLGSFPKIRKTYRAAAFTFDYKNRWVDAAVTKWLAIMRNTLCDKRQYAFYRMLAAWAHACRGGSYAPPDRDWWAKRNHWAYLDDGVDPGTTSVSALIQHLDSLPQTVKQADCAEMCAKEAGLSLAAYYDECDLYWHLGEECLKGALIGKGQVSVRQWPSLRGASHLSKR